MYRFGHLSSTFYVIILSSYCRAFGIYNYTELYVYMYHTIILYNHIIQSYYTYVLYICILIWSFAPTITPLYYPKNSMLCLPRPRIGPPPRQSLTILPSPADMRCLWPYFVAPRGCGFPPGKKSRFVEEIMMNQVDISSIWHLRVVCNMCSSCNIACEYPTCNYTSHLIPSSSRTRTSSRCWDSLNTWPQDTRHSHLPTCHLIHLQNKLQNSVTHLLWSKKATLNSANDSKIEIP